MVIFHELFISESERVAHMSSESKDTLKQAINKKLYGQNCLGAVNPVLAAGWHPTKNGALTPNDVMPMSNEKVWWKCPTCGHEWNTRVADRNRGNGCPACARRVVTPGNCLATTNPILANEWHPTKNGALTPNDIVSGSRKKVWWKCPVCAHEWELSANSRSHRSGCPMCVRKVVAAKNSLATARNSLTTINPKLAAEWHPTKNGALTPNDVMPMSNKKISWICSICSYEWEATVENRSRGHGCPACVGQTATLRNCLAAIKPNLAKEWDWKKNGTLTPNDVTPGSTKKVGWICSICGHAWESTVSNRNKGHGCPACAKRAR
jgi:rubrerythrin